jgi:hypothetical protein
MLRPSNRDMSAESTRLLRTGAAGVQLRDDLTSPIVGADGTEGDASPVRDAAAVNLEDQPVPLQDVPADFGPRTRFACARAAGGRACWYSR